MTNIVTALQAAGLAQRFCRTGLVATSGLVPEEEDQQCQQLNHIDANRPPMQTRKLLSCVGIATELGVAEFVNARHQNLPHPTSRAGDNETDRPSQW